MANLYVRRFVSRDMSQWVCMRLISNELLVSSDALHKHASLQLNCYIIEFCEACCPSLFFVCSRTIAIFVVFCVLIILFFILVVDVRISGIRVLLRFVGNGFFDVFCYASFPSVSHRFSIFPGSARIFFRISCNFLRCPVSPTDGFLTGTSKVFFKVLPLNNGTRRRYSENTITHKGRFKRD